LITYRVQMKKETKLTYLSVQTLIKAKKKIYKLWLYLQLWADFYSTKV